MDPAAIDRFSGPPLAERAWVSEQARACIVRPGTDDLQTLVERDLRDRNGELAWDSWRRPDGRWTVVAAVGADAPVSTWLYDPRSRSVHPDDAASHRLASEDVVVPLRTTTTLPRDEAPPQVSDVAVVDDAHVNDAHDDAAHDDAAHDDAAHDDVAPGDPPAPEPTPARSKSRKSRRASVPRWDEILFGAGESES
jgi:hypothetical protein